MLTPELIRRTECLGDPTALTGSSEAEYLDAKALERAVRAAVDEGVPVHLEWCDVNERWEVDVDGIVVWSVREAVLLTEGMSDGDYIEA